MKFKLNVEGVYLPTPSALTPFTRYIWLWALINFLRCQESVTSITVCRLVGKLATDVCNTSRMMEENQDRKMKVSVFVWKATQTYTRT